jgi:hypothetical protein
MSRLVRDPSDTVWGPVWKALSLGKPLLHSGAYTQWARIAGQPVPNVLR